ncbi:MAG: response regulator transcription factor [Lachnospiraceae bacterium]|nr:response regulator transcription factor [Lachnospiraceae bacterium]
MIKVAFCDDELSALNEIRVLLDRYCAKHDQEIGCTAFHSPIELMAEIENGLRPDILFLDVIMPDENGINVAKEIRRHDSTVKIIFLTSSAEYAVESYTVGAYFYQIKPICEEKFFPLMDAVVSECDKGQQDNMVLRCRNGIVRVCLAQLEYCEVIGHTLLFYMENGKVLESSGSLDELCGKLLQHDNFLRPHRSFLVNMEYIQNISYKSIIMDNSAEIPIPHGKCSEIKNRYLEYAFSKRQVFVL